MRNVLLAMLCVASAMAEIRENPGSSKPLPHQQYIRVVSEADSPVQQTYIATKDGLYVAAALRKPKGDGPFPAVIMFHGAPGGRGMEQLVGWSRGQTGGPVWERYLREGYVVVVADYRGGPRAAGPVPTDQVTSVDDGLAVLEHVRSRPYVDAKRIHLHGVSLGGNLVLNMISRTTVKSAILGAPAAMGFLGASAPAGTAASANPTDRWKSAKVDTEMAQKNIDPIQTPILILVGTADGLLPIDRILHGMLAKAGKSVRMEIYEHGYHDFCLGPQGQVRKDTSEPLLDSTLDSLEKSVQFLAGTLR